MSFVGTLRLLYNGQPQRMGVEKTAWLVGLPQLPCCCLPASLPPSLHNTRVALVVVVWRMLTTMTASTCFALNDHIR